MSFSKEFLKGLVAENPTFRLVLGMCPTLAVTTSVENAIGMGIAATFVLVCSNLVISLLRNVVPGQVRIPCYVVVIAAFVTIVDMLMNAYAYPLYQKLGIFIPLIVVNCIILGRAEAFAQKNPPLPSIADGLGMGIGFMLALMLIAAIREVTGNGTLTVWGTLQFRLHNDPVILMVLAPGGFVTLGCLLGLMNHVQARQAARQGRRYTPPPNFDCRSCTICKF